MPGSAADRIHSCDFCQEFSSGVASFLSPPRSRVLFAQDGLNVVPSAGSFIEGYLLMLPTRHYLSLAELPDNLLRRATQLITATTELLTEEYGSCIVFEHGSFDTQRGGACIGHAHLHLVGCDADLSPVIERAGPVIELTSLQELSLLRGHPYLLLGRRDNIRAVLDPKTNSQSFRRRLARDLGHADLWDWATYLGTEEMSITESRLRDAFSRLDF